ncbi:pectate lyase [Altererythrobacter sp. B11]|nr:pectate lyase [Altererythrobacter sp. B11]
MQPLQMNEPPAFPGAQGYGAVSQGGRGGRIIAVDSLADSGPGTLRECIEAKDPRVCIFRVAGTIRFTTSPPVVYNPYITIAGQTAPGGGITLAHGGGRLGTTPLLIKGAHDVIVRHIRVRNDRIGGSRAGEDSITIENSRKVIIDHVSASWARDEIINGYADNDSITISWSIFAEGLPPHDKCALLASDPVGAQRMSFISNLCAHNGDRNPDVNFPPGSCVEIVNNVLYDAQSQFAEIWESYGGSPVALVANTFRAGPSTPEHAVGIDRERLGSEGAASVYLLDNRFVGTFLHRAESLQDVVSTTPPCPLTLRAVPADRAYVEVLETAGAFPRDSTDGRIVREVRDRSGHIRKEPGRIDDAVSGEPYPDSDEDGMDDRWEASAGAKVGESDPWDDADGDGELNLDEFLAELSADRIAGADAGRRAAQ